MPESGPNEGANEEGMADQNINDDRITRLLKQYISSGQPKHSDNAISVNKFSVKIISSQDAA